MPQPLPTIRAGILSAADDRGDPQVPLVVGSGEWFHWIETATAFSLEDDQNESIHFTARKEHRASGSYWYLHLRLAGKSCTAYLGKSASMTSERLEAATRSLIDLCGSTRASGEAPHRRSTRPEEAPREPFADGGTPVLAAKVTTPRLDPANLVWTTAMRRTTKLLSHPVTVISAPAGYGKTCLLASYAASFHASTIWVTLDASDNDPVRFWTVLLTALDRRVPGTLNRVLPLLRARQPSVSEVGLWALLERLSALESPTLLVLDDYHLLSPQVSAIHAAIAYLVEHLPPHIHLAVASRTDPPLPLARWRVQRIINEIRLADLRLTLDETGQFVTQHMGLRLARDDIALLDARTEGWIAGVQLAALSLQGRADLTYAVRTLGGGDRFIFDYIVEEVLNTQPPDLQAFLLDCSILEQITASLADAVTGRRNSAALLSSLEHANFFVMPLDGRDGWMRLHPLFADALRLYLSRAQPERIPELYLRASAWCEEHGHGDAAIHYASAAGDLDRTARLVEAGAEDMIASGALQALRDWIALLPPSLVRANPRLSAASAYLLVATGQASDGEFDGFLQHLIDAERAFNTCQYPDVQGACHTLQGELLVLRGCADTLDGHHLRNVESHEALREVLPRSHPFYLLGQYSLGSAYVMQANLRGAQQTFADLVSASTKQRNLEYRYIGVAFLSWVLQLQGHLSEAFEICDQVIDDPALSHPLSESIGVDLTKGLIDYSRNHLDQAILSLERGTTLKHFRVFALIMGFPTLARAYVGRGEWSTGIEILQQAMEEHVAAQVRGRRTWVHMAKALQAHLARLQVAHGDLNAAAAWARAYELRPRNERDGIDAYPRLIWGMEQLALADVYLAEGRVGDTLTLLEQQRAFASSVGWLVHELEILLLTAIAHAKLSHAEDALRALQDALELAAPSDFTRPFLDGGLPVYELLEQLQTRASHRHVHSSQDGVPAFVASLLVAFAQSTTRLPQVSKAAAARNVRNVRNVGNDRAVYDKRRVAHSRELSDREREVLDLLATGASNQDIARQLFIEIGTVKRHVSNILGKLHVDNRTQAAAHAFERSERPHIQPA
jgi:LuxR family maltose regulon positive regulatory protein